MPKSNFQDIVPRDKRSIKRIPVPERRRQQPVIDEIDTPPADTEPPRKVRRVRRKSRLPQFLFTIIILAIIAGAGYWFVTRASGAQVSLTPKQSTVSVDTSLTAQKNTGVLPFQTFTIVKTGKLTVAANGQEYANTKASGVIVVYNTTSSDQSLIAGTRFQTPEGLIFRISDPITVPAKTDSGPGNVRAVVTADAAGPDYNVGTKDFTIPGFKGTPKYTQFYGRSDPQNPIKGGFSGMRPKVADADLQAAKTKIDAELKSNLLNEAGKDVPSGFTMPANAYYIVYESQPTTPSDQGAEVNEQATFHGFMFPKAALADNLSKVINGDTGDNQSDLKSTDNLSFTLKSPVSSTPWEADTIVFNLQGTTTLVSVINTDKIKNDLLGKPRKSLNAILAGYPSVAKAQVTMRPFWRQNFPTNPQEITVTVTTPEVSP